MSALIPSCCAIQLELHRGQVSLQEVLAARSMLHLQNRMLCAARCGGASGVAWVGRRLQQVGEVTVVTTAAALQEAVECGMPHIEIQSHLDLTTLDLASTFRLLGTIPPTVKSIRVRCISHTCLSANA